MLSLASTSFVASLILLPFTYLFLAAPRRWKAANSTKTLFAAPQIREGVIVSKVNESQATDDGQVYARRGNFDRADEGIGRRHDFLVKTGEGENCLVLLNNALFLASEDLRPSWNRPADVSLHIGEHVVLAGQFAERESIGESPYRKAMFRAEMRAGVVTNSSLPALRYFLGEHRLRIIQLAIGTVAVMGISLVHLF
jgi:hypothetical protein